MLWREMIQLYNQTFENAEQFITADCFLKVTTFSHAPISSDVIEDPRVADWPLMQSPLPTLIICLSYVYVVKYLGPSLMKNREPLDIRWLMATYNFAMVIFNFLIFYHFGIYGWFGSYSWKCQPVDYSDSIQALGMANVCWWFFISKFVEFTDTIFFVMRKKFNQISTLHVTHHGILPMSIWFGLQFTPGGHSTFFAFINSFVHILMYIYYGLAAFGPQMTKYLWWKKYMTTIQMVQFICIFTHSFQLFFQNCDYPQGFMYWIGFHAVLFWFLFADFYKNAYRKKNAAVTSRKLQEKIKQTNEDLHSQNGSSNGYSCGSNGYIAGKTGIINSSGMAQNGMSEFTSDSNGYQNKNCSIKKID